jgi:hypothetical protein
MDGEMMEMDRVNTFFQSGRPSGYEYNGWLDGWMGSMNGKRSRDDGEGR